VELSPLGYKLESARWQCARDDPSVETDRSRFAGVARAEMRTGVRTLVLVSPQKGAFGGRAGCASEIEDRRQPEAAEQAGVGESRYVRDTAAVERENDDPVGARNRSVRVS
jgi:hypothetical protein